MTTINNIVGEEGFVEVSTEMIGKRRMKGSLIRLVKIFSIGLSTYSILYVFSVPARMGILALNSLTNLTIVLGGLLVLTFLAFPGSKGTENKIPWYDFSLILIGVTPCVYYFINYYQLMERYSLGTPSTTDQIMFITLFVILLEASRRVLGITMPIVVLSVVLYAVFSNYLPGIFRGMGFNLKELTHSFYLASDGVWGVAMDAAATMIFPFMIFGRLIQTSGAGNFFLKVALSTMGRQRGPGAKAGVVSGWLWGMVSGSSTSNVVLAGTVTIPLMIKDGVSPETAAGIQSVASNGGTIMPPVMGIAAFIMCEFTGIPYGKLIFLAFIPGLLYYFGLLLTIDQTAKKLGWKACPPESVPSFMNTMVEGWEFIIALTALILFVGILQVEVGRGAILCSLVLIGIMALKSFLIGRFIRHTSNEQEGGRLGSRKLMEEVVDALQGGAITMIVPGIACATAGFIVGSFMLTGLGIRLSTDLVAFSGGNTILLLLLAAVLSFILGINLDSIPCYLVVAVLVAPTLVKQGIPIISAHLFALHWGVISYITPPVCITVFVASGIAKANVMRSGIEAMRYGIVAYVVPFIFVFNPGLVLQGPPLQILMDVAIAIVGIFCISYFAGGWLHGELSWLKRFLFLAAGLLIILPNLTFKLAGFAILTLALLATLIPLEKIRL